MSSPTADQLAPSLALVAPARPIASAREESPRMPSRASASAAGSATGTVRPLPSETSSGRPPGLRHHDRAAMALGERADTALARLHVR